MINTVNHSLTEALDELRRFLASPDGAEAIAAGGETMARALASGHKILSCGNGGSLCDATHFAEELTGRYRTDRRPWPAIAINDPAYLTCVANDYDYKSVYARYVDGVGQPGDVLLAISTSGHSPNVLAACEAAKAKGLAVVALTSDTDNPLRQLADVAVCAPKSRYSDRIQEIHIKAIHIMIEVIEETLRDK